MNERDEHRRQAYLDGYVDGKGGRSYARDYGKVIAETMDAVDRAYHTGYTAGEYARLAEREHADSLDDDSDEATRMYLEGEQIAGVRGGRPEAGEPTAAILGLSGRGYAVSCK